MQQAAQVGFAILGPVFVIPVLGLCGAKPGFRGPGSVCVIEIMRLKLKNKAIQLF